MEKGQVNILTKRAYLNTDKPLEDALYNILISEINKMKDNSFEEFRIYINIGKEVNIIPKETSDKMFEAVFLIEERYNVKVVFRFFMDEITNFNFFAMFAENGYFVVEDTSNENFLLERFNQIITSTNILLSKSLNIQEIQQKFIWEDNYVHCSDMDRIIDEMSHDFKNIFATISGYSQLAMSKIESEEVKGYLSIILDNCFNSHMVTKRFKDRTEKKNNRSIYNFNSLIMSTSEIALNMNRDNLDLNDNGISILYSLKSQRDISCDRCEIEQVIMNIIDNGTHAISGKGYIIINTYDNKDTTTLEIMDNGKGIDNITLNKIFQPYFTTKGSKGMGLGLNIAKKILEDHGATISVESKLGSGTKFTMIFPTISRELTVDTR